MRPAEMALSKMAGMAPRLVGKALRLVRKIMRLAGVNMRLIGMVYGIETDWEGLEPNLEVPETGWDGLETG